MTKKVRSLLSAHPLVGTWVDTDLDGSTTEWTVRASTSGFAVTGIDANDGEPFEVTDVTWDGSSLRFISVMPSTGHRVSHSMTADGDDWVVHSSTIIERWRRK